MCYNNTTFCYISVCSDIVHDDSSQLVTEEHLVSIPLSFLVNPQIYKMFLNSD
jgi:hypothetical protein